MKNLLIKPYILLMIETRIIYLLTKQKEIFGFKIIENTK